MRRSRLVSLAVGLLTLNISLSATDAVCSRHGTHADKGSAPAHSHHATGAPENTKPPCETPVRAACCRALTSCTQSALVSASDDQPWPMTGQRFFPRASTALQSLNDGPEPPPPRA